jgi:glycine cleavage system protein P-like pyridoxal-binding family
MGFPVAGTLMVEPTESVSLVEVDAFCEAMIAIRSEIDKVEARLWSVEDNPLRGAPHTAECLLVATETQISAAWVVHVDETFSAGSDVWGGVAPRDVVRPTRHRPDGMSPFIG